MAQFDINEMQNFQKSGGFDINEMKSFGESQASLGDKAISFGKGVLKSGYEAFTTGQGLFEKGVLNPIDKAMNNLWGIKEDTGIQQETSAKKFQTGLESALGYSKGTLTEPSNKYQRYGKIAGTLAENIIPMVASGGASIPAQIVIGTATAGISTALHGGGISDVVSGGAQNIAYDVLSQLPGLKQVSVIGKGIKPFLKSIGKIVGQEVTKGTAMVGADIGTRKAFGEDYQGSAGTTILTTAGLGTLLRSPELVSKLKNDKVRKAIADETKNIINTDYTIQPPVQPEAELNKIVDLYNNTDKINKVAYDTTKTATDSKLKEVIAKSIKPLQKEYGINVKSQDKFNEDMSIVLSKLARDDQFVARLTNDNAIQELANKIPELKEETYSIISKRLQEAGELSTVSMQKTFDDVERAIEDMASSRRYGDPDMIEALNSEVSKIKEAIKYSTEGSSMSPELYQDNLKMINQEVSNAYMKMKAMQPLTIRDKAMIMIRDFLADDLDEQIEVVLGKGKGLKEAKAEYSSIKNVEKAINKRAVQLNRVNKDTLAEQIAGYLTAGDSIFRPVEFIGKKIVAETSKRFRQRNDPNYIMRDYLYSTNQLLKSNGYIDNITLENKIQELQGIIRKKKSEDLLSTIDNVQQYKQQTEVNKPMSEEEIIRNEARQRVIEERRIKKAEDTRKSIQEEEKAIADYADKNGLDYENNYEQARKEYLDAVRRGETGASIPADKKMDKMLESMDQEVNSDNIVKKINEGDIVPYEIADERFKTFLNEADESLVGYVYDRSPKLLDYVFDGTEQQKIKAYDKIIEHYNDLVKRQQVYDEKLKKEISRESMSSIGTTNGEIASAYNWLSPETKREIIRLLQTGKTSSKTGNAGDLPGLVSKAKESGSETVKKEIKSFANRLEEIATMNSEGATREGISADDLFNTFVDMLSSNKLKNSISMNPYILSGVGTVYGFEKDENGNWRFNPEKAMQGMAMGTIAGAGIRAMSKKSYNSSRQGLFGGESATGYNKAKKAGDVFEGVDKKMRFEIDDSKAKLKDRVKTTGATYSSLGDLLEHKELFDNYPKAKDIEIGITIDKNIENPKSEYTPYQNRDHLDMFPIYENINVVARNPEEAKSTLLHEIQHAIQHEENFAKGGSPRAMGSMEKYNKLAGEVESRNVESRMDLTPEQRKAKSPFETMDVKPEDQITQFDSEASMKVSDLNKEAKKYKTKEEFIDAQTRKQYRDVHQIDRSKSTPVYDLKEDMIEEYVKMFKESYGSPALKNKELKKLKALMGDPDKDVTIYRASPNDELNSGDWVTIDKAYANDIRKQNGGKVYTYEVSAKDLFYPNTKEGFDDLPSLNKWTSFQFRDKGLEDKYGKIWEEASKK